jgi:uncharacterized protein YidB (DUF937 family)
MSKTRTVMIATLLAALAVLGGMAAAFFGAGPAVNAAPTTQDKGGATAVTTPATDTKPADTSQADAEKYLNLLDTNLASRLGISQAQLDTAITGAVSDTIDQAVADGKITQTQGSDLKSRIAANGGGLVTFFKGLIFIVDEKRGIGSDQGVDIIATVLDSASRVLGMTPDQLKDSLKQGQSITALAQAHNVSLDTLKSTVLSDLGAALDKAVADGKITQAERDAIYNKVSMGIDALLNGGLGGEKR